ncbi:hypothetical protein ARMSODRAFT_898125, partial [Armillaria solidipes]
PDISREVWAFLLKSMHEIHTAGDCWEKFQGREHLGECPHCKVTESMEHMTECNIPAQMMRLAQRIWEMKFTKLQWPSIKYGTILSIALI